MKIQVIEKDGQPEWAVIPYETYQHLVADAEMLQDIRDYDKAKKALEEGEELVPSEVTYAILDGANPIKVWRTYRGLTQQQLAKPPALACPTSHRMRQGNVQEARKYWLPLQGRWTFHWMTSSFCRTFATTLRGGPVKRTAARPRPLRPAGILAPTAASGYNKRHGPLSTQPPTAN